MEKGHVTSKIGNLREECLINWFLHIFLTICFNKTLVKVIVLNDINGDLWGEDYLNSKSDE